MPRLMFRDDQYRRIEPLLSGKASDVGGARHHPVGVALASDAALLSGS